MGIKAWTSNDLNELVQKIDLSYRDPFSKHNFIVQTSGLQHWLTLALTKRDGVFANHDFFKPNDLILRIGKLLRLPNCNEYSAENLRWHIFSLLNNISFKSKFPDIANYYKNHDLKCIQLASQIADLFDQYSIYRPELLLNWEQNSPYNGPNSAWQKWLWLNILKENVDKSIHRLAYKGHLMRALSNKDSQVKIKKSINELHIFGLSILTQYHADLYSEISKVIPITFYFLNPCPDIYWYDLHSQKQILKKWKDEKEREFIKGHSSGNTLLTSWGRTGQEMFSTCFDTDDDFLNHGESITVPIEVTSLLTRIQNEIINNTLDKDRQQVPNEYLNDESIQITSNYSESREVEVLYNYLLHNFEKKTSSLQSDEILVMVSDVEKYKPYISAIFDNAPFAIPYSIGDIPVQTPHSITSFLLEVLNYLEEDINTEQIIRLLDYPFIIEHYRFQDIQFILKSIDKCNLRYSISGELNNESSLVSFNEGIKRMIYGIAMRSNEYSDNDGSIFPYQQGEGNNVEELLKLITFLEDLKKIIKTCQNERTMDEWVEYSIYILSVFSDENFESENEYLTLRKKFSDFLHATENSKQQKLSHRVFTYILKDNYQNEITNKGYFQGKITFCTALPMRSIPFKIICFLGLNAGTFPRQNNPRAFDLISNSVPQRGDRNIKDNDRYLFLEALMNTKDSLYLSYIGKDSKSNKAKNPSILVDELLDYIKVKSSGSEIVENSIIQHHPLHGHSIKYTQEHNGLYTYFDVKQNKTPLLKSLLSTENNTEQSNIYELNDLKKFFRFPAQYYFNNHLNIYYRDEEELLSKSEVFEINPGIDKYQLDSKLINISEECLADFILEYKHKGLLPLSNMGTYMLKEQYDSDIKNIYHYLSDLTSGNISHEESFKLDCESGKLNGEVDSIYGDQLIHVMFSNENRVGKYLFPLYIDLLFLKSNNINIKANLISKEKHYKLNTDKLDVSTAKIEINKLLKIFNENQNVILEFNPMLSYFCIAPNAYKSVDALINKYQTHLEKECDYNEYLKKSYELNTNWKFEHVEAIAKSIMLPLLDILEIKPLSNE